jgi:hypothetical protein
MRYDRLYETLVGRAIRQGGLDLDTMTDMARNAGMSPEGLRLQLLQDLDTGGPVFGRLLRGFGDVSEATVMAAKAQGEAVGSAVAEGLIARSRMDTALLDADAEALQEIEDETADMEYTWVAALVNTCHKCLPLHGVTMTRREWDALGYHPDYIHPASWGSRCHCHFVRAADVDGDPGAPLRRVRVETTTGLKGSRKTRRAVADGDILKAIEARDKALESDIGRRTLRILGQSRATEEA